MALFHHDDAMLTDTGAGQNLLASQSVPIVCLSGNELYCVALTGYTPGNILVGNSVYALGVFGNFASNIHASLGGEIPQYTNMISEGRRLALEHFEEEMAQANAVGAAGLTSEVIFHPENVEFLAIGSSLYKQGVDPTRGVMTASTSGQELFCLLDAGFQPLRMAFGNVTYSIGIGGNILGDIRQMAHGEVSQYSNIFTTTRNLALERIMNHAKQFSANSITSIRTTILPMGNKGLQEMIMVGTAAYHPALTTIADKIGGPVTSGLTDQELWSIMRLGYAPVKLVIGTSVYSLGIFGGIKAAIRSLAKGQVNSLTEMVYGAREESLKKIQDQAVAEGADMVMGAKTYIYHLENGLVEFLAIGTAVKRMEGIAPHSDQLPPQAIINDVNTFVDRTQRTINFDHQPANKTSEGPPPDETDAHV